jgi:hypothetical protein
MSIERDMHSNEHCVSRLYDLMIEYGVIVFLASLKEALCIWKKNVPEILKSGGM